MAQPDPGSRNGGDKPHGPHLALTTTSPWVERFMALIPPGGSVLDLAAGGGRHTRLLLDAGIRVVALDRDITALAELAGRAGLEIMRHDLEDGAPWPFAERAFGGIVVTNYLWRPLLPAIVAAVAPGGALIYETFARGNERFGKPSNPAFLLAPGELLEAVRGRLRVIAYEDLEVSTPRPAMVQRIAAVKEPGA